MIIQQVYQKYKTPKNIQEHMLRVSALSKIICDNWTGNEIDKEAIIKACALHDITKPAFFDNSIENITKYGMDKNDRESLLKFQKEIKTKYGDDEHKSTTELCRDLGMNQLSLDILGNIEWKYIPKLIKQNDFNSLISIYCDMRISPNGILTMLGRIANLKSRYAPDKYDYVNFEKNGLTLEPLIKENVKLDLNSVSDKNLNSLFSELLNLEI